MLADVPGLIEGAAEGAGLGHEFLRHLGRTRALVHLVDAQPLDGSNPVENYRTVRAELLAYSPALAEKPEVIALNKIDLLPEGGERDEAVRAFRRALRTETDAEAVPVSAAARLGLRDLLEKVWGVLKAEGVGKEGW